MHTVFMKTLLHQNGTGTAKLSLRPLVNSSFAVSHPSLPPSETHSQKPGFVMKPSQKNNFFLEHYP